MVQPKQIPREEFPMSQAFSSGMIPLQVDCDHEIFWYTRDVVYQEREEMPLHLQLLLQSADPSSPEKSFPLIVLIPGSAFHKQDVPGAVGLAGLLACRGFSVALVEYRPSEVAPFPAQMLDAKAAVRYMKRNAEKYRIDPEKVVLMGDSSGGHTALMAAFTQGISSLEEPEESQISSSVRGVIDLYAPVNIATMNEELSTQDHTGPDSPEGYLIGRKPVLENPQLVEPTVVTRYISQTREIPPVLIFHGSNDELVPFSQSCELYDALKQKGKKAAFYQILGAHHGGKEFWCTQVLDKIEAFIREVIEPIE